MNGPLNSAGSGNFISSLKAISDFDKTTGRAFTKLQGVEFSDLIDQQNGIPGLLEELKGLLPEQDFSQIEAFINDGNALPPAAESDGDISLLLGGAPFPITANLAVTRIAEELPSAAAGPVLSKANLAAAESGGELSLLPGGAPFPIAANLAVVRTVGELPSAAAGVALSDANLPTVQADGKLLTAGAAPGVSTDTIGTLSRGAALTTAEPLQVELESVARARGTALQESAFAGHVSPPSALKSAETASMRTGSPNILGLETPLTTKGWDQGVGDRIMWMLGNSVNGASLRINPAHLGPIEIQISMHQDQATVSFSAQHAVVRDALEASIPRLRDMFQENNLQLANVDVGQRGSSQQRASDGGADGSGDGTSRENSEQSGYAIGEAQEPIALSSGINGLLDDYA